MCMIGYPRREYRVREKPIYAYRVFRLHWAERGYEYVYKRLWPWAYNSGRSYRPNVWHRADTEPRSYLSTGRSSNSNGFWAYKSLCALQKRHALDSGYVCALVELKGSIVEHEEGYRAYRMRIVKILRIGGTSGYKMRHFNLRGRRITSRDIRRSQKNPH